MKLMGMKKEQNCILKPILPNKLPILGGEDKATYNLQKISIF
jgi:hypothetical protein